MSQIRIEFERPFVGHAPHFPDKFECLADVVLNGRGDYFMVATDHILADGFIGIRLRPLDPAQLRRSRRQNQSR